MRARVRSKHCTPTAEQSTTVNSVRAGYFVDQVAREELGEECDYEKEAANQVSPDLCFELRRVKP